MKYKLASLTRQLDAKTLDRLALLCSVVLVVLVAKSLASATWVLLPGKEQAAPPVAAVGTPSARQGPQADYRQLSSLQLFGRPQTEAVAPTTAAPIDAPETQLNLTLRGILFNTDPRYARAIIEAPGKGEEMYKVGDQVAGATIDGIYTDRVMLLRNGRHEALRLPEDRIELGQQPRGNARQQPAQAASPQLPSGDAAGTLAEYRRQIIENPQDATQFLQAEPVNRSGGGIAGFRVNPGADPGMFQVSGLEAGDIVTSVNGVQLDSIDKGFQAIEELAASETITLQVLRNGQEQTLQLQLRN